MANDQKPVRLKFAGFARGGCYRHAALRGKLNPGDVGEFPADVADQILKDHGDAFQKVR